MRRFVRCYERPLCALLALMALALWTPLRAAALEYETGETLQLSLPYDALSFGTSVGSFPESTVESISGYSLVGRMIAATGRTVYLQASSGEVTWRPVAELDADADPMDPCFVVVSRDGRKIALGTGFGKPLYVFPTYLLSTDVPLNLNQHRAVKRWDLSYYDGVFRDARFLFINRGADNYQSEILAIDTEQTGPEAITIAVSEIPGASAGLAFDDHGNLVTGIGWDPEFTRTGELRIFDARQLDAALGEQEPRSYDDAGQVIAHNVLSAASLAFDSAGNLIVGGGDVFGNTGNLGYAAIIDASVLERVRAGGAPLDPNSPVEFTRIAPDPCMNDDATKVVYVSATQALMVSYNALTQPPECAPVDWSGAPGSANTVQVYFPKDAPDEDGDGIPDGIDADFGKPDPTVGRADYLRLVNAFGAREDDIHFDGSADYDRNGLVDELDYRLFLGHWGTPRPL